MRKYIAEFIGTAVLVLFGCGSAVTANTLLGDSGQTIPLAFSTLLIAFAFGLSIVAMAYSIGNVSGCHINPAVSFGMLVAGKMEVKDFIGYVIAQFLGGIVGAGILSVFMGGTESGLGINGFGEASALGTSMGVAFLVEVVLTFVFVLLILGVTSKAEFSNVAGLMIGLTLVLIHILGIPFTGTSVNPARSFEPALLVGGTALRQVWLFIVAPLVGGGGFAFAVDKEEGTFTYYPDDTLVGRKATSYGLKKSELKDGYCDYLTIESEKYYASSVETDDSYVYVAVPDHEIMKQRRPLTLATGVISFICIILLFILLSFKRNGVLLPDRKGTGAEEEDDRMINVVLPDGRVKQTESAASRWMSIALKWDEKTPEQQIATVVKFLIGILAVAICLGVVFREAIFQKDSIFNYIVDGGWEKGVNIFAITASIMIIAVVMTGTEIVKRILKLLASVFGARGETGCRLISSFIKYVAIVAMLYYCFALFGVDTATLLASAGILSIAISLGAKDMVGDILAGLFIIFEGEFRVGDIVMIGD